MGMAAPGFGRSYDVSLRNPSGASDGTPDGVVYDQAPMERSARLRDDSEVVIRPLERGDADLPARGFDALRSESRCARFLTGVPRLPQQGGVVRVVLES